MTRLHQINASVYTPDGVDFLSACRRITHLGIGAHQDDLEIMAFHGIVQHFKNPKHWFGGIICKDGGPTRQREQEKAANIGQYGLLIQLNNPNQLNDYLIQLHPDVLYTHSPFDKHPTHIKIFQHVLETLRRLPRKQQPQEIYGCEVWRDLDWLPDDQKVRLDVSGHDALAKKLIRTFASQTKHKKYLEATLGRRQANATFFDPYDKDRATQIQVAIDLSPLVRNKKLDIRTFVDRQIEQFKKELSETHATGLSRRNGQPLRRS